MPARADDRLVCAAKVRRRCVDASPCRAMSSGCAATQASAASTTPSRDPPPKSRPAPPASAMRPGRSGNAWRRSWPSWGCSPGSIAACSPPIARRMRCGSRQCPRVERYGTMVKSPNGYPMQSPYVAVANKQVDIMVRIAAEFGMTPEFPHAHPGRRQVAGRPLRHLPAAAPCLASKPDTTRSPPTRVR